MVCECPDSRFFADLTDLNREFLGLMTDSRLAPGCSVLGMDPAWINLLAGLNEEELRYISRTPCLLAEFVPPEAVVVAAMPLPDAHVAGWQSDVTLYSVTLLSFLRATLGRDQLLAALCVGPEPGEVCRVAELSLGGLGGYAAQASGSLQARLVDAPNFWPDLIRASRSENRELRHLSRVAAIPLVVSPAVASRNRTV
jgi:hypothetical protein